MAVLQGSSKSNGKAEQTRGFAGPVAVGSFIAPVAGRALSRGGAVLSQLTCEWPAIAGPTLAAYTHPDKLTKAAPEPNSSAKTPPSVLHLKVDPARALEVQYSTPQLIERINQTLGYRAVSGLRIVQGPVFNRTAKPARAVKPAPSPAVKPAPAEPPKPENRLAAALARMSNGVKARASAS
jgi:hypothetical protein